MKKYYLLSLLALAPIANAEEQTVTNLYADVVLSDPNNILKPDISNASIYKVGSADGETFTGSVSATETTINNLNLSYQIDFVDDGSGGNALNTKTAFSLTEDLTVNDINVNATLADGVWVSNMLVSSGGTTRKITARNLTITSLSKTYNPWYYFNNVNINLSGDLTVSLAETGNKQAATRLGTSTLDWSVAGNVTLNSVRYSEFLIQASKATIGGIVNLNVSNPTTDKSGLYFRGSGYKATNVSIGGLTSTNLAVLGVQIANAMDINLTFTNSEAYDVQTAFVNSIDNTTGKFNIIMNASDVKGKQTLRFNYLGGGQISIAGIKTTDHNINNVTVSNGTLVIGMYDGLHGDTLKIDGENAAFSSTSIYSGNVGNAYFSTIDFVKGTLVFDYSIDEGNDLIVVTDDLNTNDSEGTFFVDSVENTKFVLQSENDIKSWLEEGEVLDALTILTFDSTNLTAEDIANIKVDAGEGLNAILSAIEENGNIIGIQAEITLAVPEPATVAGIFGALALAFAIYRRRK